MELKYENAIMPTKAHDGSNRTFMELKYVRGNEDGWVQGVLIAPLWN